MIRLKPEDLVVVSFDAGGVSDPFATEGTIDNPTDPTPATHCRICPEYQDPQ